MKGRCDSGSINLKNCEMRILIFTVAILLFFAVQVSSAGARTDISSISGFKINDTDGDGQWDVGETGISDWHIRLIEIVGQGNGTNFIRKRTSTDVQGYYRFDNLPRGMYIVIEKNQKGWIPTDTPLKILKLKKDKSFLNVNFTNRQSRIRPPTPPTGAPNIISFFPPSPVSDVAGDSRTFSITVNQTVNVSWQINGTEILNQTGVTESTYTGINATPGKWNVTAIAGNVNGTVSHNWEWIVTPAQTEAPSIISFAPPLSVSDTIGASRTFNVTINQPANETWHINGTEVFNQTCVIESNYSSTSATLGTWNVTVVASNVNGTVSHEWTWNVTKLSALGTPTITGSAPSSPVNDIVEATRIFNITVNQTGNVTWYINGTQVFNQTVVNQSTYTNTSAAQGNSNCSEYQRHCYANLDLECNSINICCWA